MKILQRLSLILNKVSHVEIAYLAMQYMHSHYAENITLETLSKVTNCHPTHLIRCMKKQYNLSPIQALTKIRLNNACILLSEGNLSVTEIAYLTGFSSVSYFGKLFKDAFSCSPKEYRTKNWCRKLTFFQIWMCWKILRIRMSLSKTVAHKNNIHNKISYL